MIDSTAHLVTDVDTLQARVGGEPHPAILKKIGASLDEKAIAFIGQSPFVMLATCDADGFPEVSPKGDGPGFVWVENETTLWLPDRTGNKLIMGLKNVLSNPRAALLFVIPGTEETLRVSGKVTVHDHPEVLERFASVGRPAHLAIRMSVDKCFFHCAKAFKRSSLWQAETWPKPFRVSFGEILAAKMGGDAAMQRDIDALVDQDYRENL
ncbi:MSMEG_1061 family FMN-dependent PPOX-type flavoprotein [Pseudomonas marincola]|uniref:MSMEG_1061 family FMN-dependent PPOX-type flavoprotein n=1 Tax=Pseudomonas marincola TaxID=437900 RepID=UPI0008EDBF33|nr:MSMEG_1061 family FMN-dependent PPOX-type flavoprotein [Pseudomonas marincola]SFU08601.1 hypothetical protein SAMN05216264_1113 [Pseudomonas marincola]